MSTTVSALAQWFGSNRILAAEVGHRLAGCEWVGVPFAGGMSELFAITARTMLVSDLHRHVINLARVVRDDTLRPQLIRRLRRRLFHPDELAECQAICRRIEPAAADLDCAEAYHVCCWMSRSGKSGISDEFNGRTSTRWNASGGDSVVRFRNSIKMLHDFACVARRCSFETMDAFDFLARCEDAQGHGIYCDPPFPGAGRKYRHNCGRTDQDEREWHTGLAEAVHRFQKTRVVMRFYDHPLIRKLYPESDWQWVFLKGRKQTNDAAPEVLLVNDRQESLFGEIEA